MKTRKKYFSHVAYRAKQRYGIDLTERMLQKLAHKVRCQDGIFLFRCRRKRHLVTYVLNCMNKKVVVGYNAKLKRISTFLPIENRYKEVTKGII